MLNWKLIERLKHKWGGWQVSEAGTADGPEIYALYLEKLVEEEHIELTPDVLNAAGAAITDALTNPNRRVLVCRSKDGEVIGQIFVDLLPEPTGEGVYTLAQAIYVERSHRETGIAQALIAGVAEFSKNARANAIRFFHGSEGCSKFYESLGFEVSRIEYEVTL
jgi:GNAT superfamily N-acetyltransferase